MKGSRKADAIARRIERLHLESLQLQDDLQAAVNQARNWINQHRPHTGAANYAAAETNGERGASLEVLEAMPDGFLLVDQRWRIRYLNPAAQRLLAAMHPSQAVVGLHLWDSLRELRPSAFYRKLHMAMALQETADFEEFLPLVHWWLDVHAYPVEGGLAVCFRDITSRKMEEEVRRGREVQFRALFDSVLDAVVITDNDRTYRDVNPAACRLLGMERPQIVGRRMDESAGGSAIGDKRFWQHFLQAREQTGEVCLRLPDGAIREAEYTSRADFLPGLHVFILRDITERKRAEQYAALQSSIAQFLAKLPSMAELRRQICRIIAECAGWPVAILWEPDQERKALRCAGYWSGSPSDFAEWEMFCQHAALERGHGLPGRIWENGEPLSCDFARDPDPVRGLMGADGICSGVGFPVWVRSEFAGVIELLSTGPRPVEPELLLVLRAIGQQVGQFMERKQAEEQRDTLLAREQAARAAAERAARTMELFLATVSHELRTPLTAMLGYSRLLRTRELDPGQRAISLETIERNSRSMSKLVDDLLDHCRIITGKMRLDLRQVDISEVVSAAVENARPAASANQIEIRASGHGETAPVLGDPDRLQQIVSNILSNAVKFSLEGGQVEVKLQLNEGHARVVVTDTGVGIEPEFLPHVFEAFRQGDPSSGRAFGGLGLGLGLALVQELVRLHGGAVEARSGGKGKGASFTLTFPLASQAAPAAAQPVRFLPAREHSDASGSLKGFRVLVVEDDADTRGLLQTALRGSGAQVKAVASSRRAMEALPVFKPDLLISDVAMPREDGYVLIRRVRRLNSKRLREIPAIALTAHAGPQDRASLLAAGFDLHVPKPVDPIELAGIAASLLQPAEARKRAHG